jgi:hypothetical protein
VRVEISPLSVSDEFIAILGVKSLIISYLEESSHHCLEFSVKYINQK